MVAFQCLPYNNAGGNLLKALEIFQKATKEKTLGTLQHSTSWIHPQTDCLDLQIDPELLLIPCAAWNKVTGFWTMLFLQSNLCLLFSVFE